MFTSGTNRVLYIKWDNEYLPIGCLTSDSFSESCEMLDTTTRDNAGWKTSTPTLQSYNISFDGLIINSMFSGGDFTKVSYDRLKKLKRDRSLIEWKYIDTDGFSSDSGKGYLTELSYSSSIDEFISFNASIDGFGYLTLPSSGRFYLQSEIQYELPNDSDGGNLPTAIVIRLKNTGSTFVTICWDAADEYGSGIKSYQIFQDGISVQRILASPLQDSYCVTIGDLTPNTTYTFKINATDFDNNSSEFSNEIEVTTLI